MQQGRGAAGGWRRDRGRDVGSTGAAGAEVRAESTAEELARSQAARRTFAQHQHDAQKLVKPSRQAVPSSHRRRGTLSDALLGERDGDTEVVRLHPAAFERVVNGQHEHDALVLLTLVRARALPSPLPRSLP